jgi:Zn-dependent protease/predicted transcriptional regulator
VLTGGWRIGRIGGVEIRVDPSWGIIAVLFTFSFWTAYSDRFRFPTLGGGAAGAFAILTSLLFFGSVLAHELAHAGMSKVRDIPVSGITLFLFGGATHAKVDAKGPADEFLITVVGPLTSGLLGLVFLVLHRLSPETFSHPFSFMFRYLAFINISLAAFNLLPGFPLDGGRLLRSGLWRAMGLPRATQVAARVGQAVGLLIAASGLVIAVRGGDLTALLWLGFIGWFLFRAASASLAETERIRLLRSTTAGDIMSPPPPTIPADLQVAIALERYLDGHDGEAFPVVEDGHVVGFVSPRTARDIPLNREVRDAMVQGQGVIEARPSETMHAVTERLGAQRGQTVLVVDQGRLVGVIEREDLARFLRRRVGLPTNSSLATSAGRTGPAGPAGPSQPGPQPPEDRQPPAVPPPLPPRPDGRPSA